MTRSGQMHLTVDGVIRQFVSVNETGSDISQVLHCGTACCVAMGNLSP